MNRPPELIVAVILAIFLALCAALVSWTAVAAAPADQDPWRRSMMDQAHFPGPVAAEMWVAWNARPIGGVLLAGSLLGLIASVQLLRLRPWARPILEGLAWFALAFLLGLRSLRITSRLFMLPAPPTEAALIIARGVLGVLIYALPFVGLIYLLRRSAVRETLARI